MPDLPSWSLPSLSLALLFILCCCPAVEMMSGGTDVLGGFRRVGWPAGLLLLAGVMVMVMVIRAVRWVWWTPRRLERILRAQDIGGTPYRLLFGDVGENARLVREATSKPMPSFSHDTAARILPVQHRAMEAHGKIWFTWLGPVPRVSIMDPDLIREILSNKLGHFEKQRITPLFKLFLTGLVTYEGEKWAAHRRIINPAFHLDKLKLMFLAFSACCTDLVRRWEELLGPEESCEVDVWPEIQNFSRDVISRTAFGSSFEEGRHIIELQEQQAKLAIQSFQKWLIPGYRYLPTKTNRRLSTTARQIDGLLRDLIRKREKAMRSGTAGEKDLLALLLESNFTDSKENGGSKEFRMTIEDVMEECKLFYFAGQETTADLLSWTMILLSMNPQWQERARAEVLQVFGKKKPDFDGLSQLKIVTMILHEVLRLYPPALFLNRCAYKTIKLGQYTFPAGVRLLLPILLIQHDPDIWGEDAKEFNPGRFSEGVSKASKNPMAFFPFGGGPRICVGQSFAMIEAKVCLATILQNFSFEISPTYVHAPTSIITLQPQHGAQVILHKL